ncbi:MAG: hypothetical protein QM784_24165 [Polyangiaceae bacterium]
MLRSRIEGGHHQGAKSERSPNAASSDWHLRHLRPAGSWFTQFASGREPPSPGLRGREIEVTRAGEVRFAQFRTWVIEAPSWEWGETEAIVANAKLRMRVLGAPRQARHRDAP